MAGKRSVLLVLIPLLAAALCISLGLGGVLAPLSGSAHDVLLRIRPRSAASRDLLLLDVDARAFEQAGPWPWGREIFADGLVQLKELGAECVVFDLPMAEAGRAGSGSITAAQAVPLAFQREFALIGGNIQSLFDAIRRGSIMPKDSPRFVEELVGLVDQARARLLAEVQRVRDGDLVLGQAVRFFARAWLPLEALAAVDASLEPALVDFALGQASLPFATLVGDPPALLAGVRPVPRPVIAGARGGGFSRSSADADGVIRRVTPIAACGGRIVAGVALAALLERLGDPAILIRDGRVELHDAKPPGMPTRDIVMPLGHDGSLLLDWPAASGSDGFRHWSWGDLLRLARLEQELVAALRDLEGSGHLPSRESGGSPLDRYEFAATLGSEMLYGGQPELETEWLDARHRFFTLAEAALYPSGDRSEADGECCPPLEEARRLFAGLKTARAAAGQAISGSFCIVSLAAPRVPGARPALTPLGASASEGSASAALVNTVLTGRFLRQPPRWAGCAIAAALSLLAGWSVMRLRPGWALAVGVAFVAVVLAGSVALLVLASILLDPAVPAASAGLTCAAFASVGYLRGGLERRTARRRFAGRVAPRKLRLLVAASAAAAGGAVDGERRTVTVIASRLAGLPAVDDPRAPPVASRALRDYHAAMGAVILGEGGTILLAAAGAITACFGAPLDDVDHAGSACRCAVGMREAERLLNRRLLDEGTLSAPFITGIGAAVGDCLTGDLGMPAMPGYGLAGVPLETASRLRDLAVRYGTAALVTEPVRAAGGDRLLARMVGRVNVAGASQPLRFFELMAAADGAEPAVAEAVSAFHDALRLLEAGDRLGAEGRFRRVLELLPGDGPARAYLERCRTPAAAGDGTMLPEA